MKKEEGGMGTMTLLTIIFVILKLCGVIDWSWIWVLCPLWIPFVLGLGIVGVVLIAFICVVIFVSNSDRT